MVGEVPTAEADICAGSGATQSDAQWVLSGYALTFGIVLVAAGRAGDLWGRGGTVIMVVICALGVAVNVQRDRVKAARVDAVAA